MINALNLCFRLGKEVRGDSRNTRKVREFHKRGKSGTPAIQRTYFSNYDLLLFCRSVTDEKRIQKLKEKISGSSFMNLNAQRLMKCNK